MNSNIMQCDDQELKRLLAADDRDIGHDRWMGHVEQCAQCQTRLRELAADDDQWQKAVAVLAGEDEAVPCFGRSRETSTSWNEAMARQLLQPPSHPEMLGRLGRYEIERMIGSGGMGIVFKAFDTELNRVVAVKVLAPYLSARGSARQRFAREARAAAGVRDDHVVPIFNVESEHEPPFLVMQYVAGGSLQEKLDRDGPLEVAEVLRIGLQTAKGLAAAHAQGLIHRDVKPSNILLDEGVERALLTDFGLARAEDDACLTRSGFHPGTPHYMSPEQVRGDAIDGRSDLFSLGCVLYALCTGHSPFRADTSYAVMRRITDETPRPIRQLNNDIPQWLDAIVMKLLAKSRDDRFDSANQVAELLEACLAHVQEPTTSPLPTPVAKIVTNFSVKDSNSWSSESGGGFNFPRMTTLIAAAFAMPLLIAGIFITLETSKGTITIKSEADDVPVIIKQGDKVYDKLTVGRDDKSIRLYAGQYEVTFDGELDRMAIENGSVELRRGKEVVVRIHEELGIDGGTEELSSMPSEIPVEDSQTRPEAGTLEALNAEFDRVAAKYNAAIGNAVGEVELNRVYQELDPREVMTPKYLKYEKQHRGTNDGLQSLVKVAEMARSVGDPNSVVGKGRVEVIDRLIQHYLDHEGLETIAGTLQAGPPTPRSDEFLNLLVEKSPFRKTQAEALIAQIIHGKELLTAVTGIPSHRKRMEGMQSVAPQSARDDYREVLDRLESTDTVQLKVDLNKKLKQLVENYSDVAVEYYGTARSASERLSHAINKVVVGSEAPEMVATDINGAPFRLSNLRGEIAVLVFAQSAGDNLREMYAPLRQLVAKYKQMPVRVIGIMSSGDRKILEEATARGDFNWTVIPQPYSGPLQLDWGIEGYPTVYVVDAKGILHGPLNMPYFGDGGYDTIDVDEKLEELIHN
ncbi:protein kinase domain-containing protein [Stieleria varia]|uniref:non-specific serine/threonine protein kinase n=1 Tax=Stieleria varia TaxID=2528005 RepID=A0A5C6AYP8_9BACT|nr:protein kinase [Stieleria varia]TWU04798.1 Serine/threonine-protein kinase PknB [Stieleria varia]